MSVGCNEWGVGVYKIVENASQVIQSNSFVIHLRRVANTQLVKA